MVKQKILIHGISDKEGKTGQKYYSIDTSKGKMSCFPDYAGLKDLKEAYTNETEIEVNVETSEDGKFQNIRNERKAVAQDGDAPIYQPKTSERKSVKGSAYEKDPVGLAVEVFNALIEHQKDDELKAKTFMECAINIVKQAQKAFS